MKKFFASEALISLSDKTLSAKRTGFRAVLKDSVNGYSLSKYVGGQMPYYYRKLDSVVADFESGNNALEAVCDLMSTAPTEASFRNSHCGEIIASLYVGEKVGVRRLYSKLTMTTSENTNPHKMDALFVDMSTDDYECIFVEAKSSILPTEATPKAYHRHGILKQMLESLHGYGTAHPRMEMVRIRENLENTFEKTEREKILNDLRPPGPELGFLGVSVTNAPTVSPKDDDFILSSDCSVPFSYHAVVVTNLESIASEAYSKWDAVKAAVENDV